MRGWGVIGSALGVVGALGMAPASPAAEAEAGRFEAWREGLEASGVAVDVGYFGEVMGTAAGGLRQGAIYEGLAEATLDLDLGRLVGWQGGRFQVSGIQGHGESPTAELVGDVQGLSNIDVFRHAAMLYELWLEQSMGSGMLAVRAGLVAADTETTYTAPGALFLNSSFGWPASIALNTVDTGPAFFRPAAGVQLRVRPAVGWQVHLGVYDGDTFDGDREEDGELSIRWGEDDGTFGMVEVSRWWGGDEDAPGGRIRLGAWGHTLEVPAHLDSGDLGRLAGVYGGAEQVVWRDGTRVDRTLAIFTRLGWSPPERSVAEWSGDTGACFSGLLPERSGDSLGLGLAWVDLSGDYRAAAADPVAGYLPREAEVVLEVTWRVGVAEWLAIQPDYQWVIADGGRGEVEDAHVVGLRTEVRF